MNEYKVYQPNLGKLQHEVEKLNRRAVKIGAQPIVLTLGRTVDEPIYNEEDTCTPRQPIGYRRFQFITVNGEAPKFAGWSLAAVVEHAEEGNLLRKSPDCTVELNKFRTGAQRCEHCNAVRNRRETYIVLHESGTLKMVGSDCIRDFLGHKDPASLARMAELVFSLHELCEGAGDEDFFGMGGIRSNLASVRGILNYSACVIRRLGFVSSKRAKEDLTGRTMSTAATASYWMDPPRNAKLGKDYFQPEDCDGVAAEAARNYVLETLGSRDVEKLSDFEHNMLVACRCEAVEHRNVGLLAFVPEYYARSIQDAKQAATEVYFGEVKKRYRGVELTYIKSTGWESQYGYTYLHTFSGPEGVRILWKSTANVDVAPSAKLVATFTVKSHEEFKGHKQTKVARMVMESPASQPGEPLEASA